jgi:tryptophan-rich sensory protein
MQIADAAQERLTESLNAEGRSLGHVAAGVAVCAVLIGITATLSAVRVQPPAPGAKPSRHPIVRAVWPSLFSVTTLAALRVWNAPPGPRRTHALRLWSLLQASNILITAWRPLRRSEQVAAAATTAALTAAYAHAASYVDEKAATMTAPTGFAGLASIVATPAR